MEKQLVEQERVTWLEVRADGRDACSRAEHVVTEYLDSRSCPFGSEFHEVVQPPRKDLQA